MAARQLARRHLWMALGWASLGLGALGVLLPLLPTTPFLILAAYFFSRSSQRVHAWLLNHRVFGPPIENWRTHRAISTGAKLAALAAMALILAVSAAANIPAWALAIQAVILAGVAIFLLTRPTPTPRSPDP
ncbi:MAG: DUF454 domain-containing protein [Gammaproteobacteria bacterium]|nr:DUF454 domain-containing protein [Gammaproteobacteria bacterium]MYH14701.1 DUF454 domain-containing protein [Gammaproteobacteria bacterium]MYK84784.1 DUF454 domain-containing protein [Gammaproteobacteria bacterium]